MTMTAKKISVTGRVSVLNDNPNKAMNNLTHKAKIAIIKILTEILSADDIVRESELQYRNDVAESFMLKQGYETEVERCDIQQALEVVKTLSAEQKSAIAQMMGTMIVIDKDINYNEVKLYNDYCTICGINNTFEPDEYPEYYKCS